MVWLWALMILAAVVTPAHTAVTVTTDQAGRMELSYGGRPAATIALDLAGPDWSSFSFMPEVESRSASPRAREVEVQFQTWDSPLRVSCTEKLQAESSDTLSARYDFAIAQGGPFTRMGVLIALPSDFYRGTEFAAYDADGTVIQKMQFPAQFGKTFLLGLPGIARLDVAPNTPFAYSLLLPESARVSMQDNRTWGSNEFQLAISVPAITEGARSLASGSTASLSLQIAFGRPAIYLLDPASNVSTTDTSGWVPYTLPWDRFPVDLSWLNDKPAGSHGLVTARNGRFEFADGTPVRFWGVNNGVTANYPAHEESELIAARMAASGINLVRTTHLDAFWHHPNLFDEKYPDTQHLNAETLERFDYFVYCLKKNGIYVYLDQLVSRRFTEADGVVNAAQLPMAAKAYVYFDATLIALQKKYSHDLWTHVNPYTGLAYKDDPVFAMMDVVNENDLLSGEVVVEPYATHFEEMWRQWAAKHGANPNQPVRSSLERSSEVLRFIDEVQRKYYAEMHQYLRSLGVKVPITGDAWLTGAPGYPSQVTMDFMDAHVYWDHPTDNYDRCRNDRMVNVDPNIGANTVSSLAMSRVLGKPLVVSEWGHPWPNDWRSESPLFIAAVGSLQDWNALLAYAYRGTPEATVGHLSGPFELFNDPAVFGLFPAAALMYRRGDVACSPSPTAIQWSDQQVFAAPVCYTSGSQPAYRSLVEATSIVTTFSPAEGVKAVVSPADHKPTAGKTFTRSDTGELWRDWEIGLGKIDSPRSQGVYGCLSAVPEIALRDVTLRLGNPFGAVVVTSLDGEDVRDSRHLLVTAVGRAENTGAAYNLTHTKLKEKGSAPILAEPIAGQVALTTSQVRFHVFALDPNGSRRPLPDLRAVDGKVALALGPAARTIYYELEAF